MHTQFDVYGQYPRKSLPITIPQTNPRPLPTFTAREAAAIRGLLDGITSKQMARREGTTQRAIRMRLMQAYRKLGVRNRTEAVLTCMALGRWP